jgi:hypothetical protein
VADVDLNRTRETLARYRDDLRSARIIAAHCHEQMDQAEREEIGAERRLNGCLMVLEEKAPEVWEQLTEEERARG